MLLSANLSNVCVSVRPSICQPVCMLIGSVTSLAYPGRAILDVVHQAVQVEKGSEAGVELGFGKKYVVGGLKSHPPGIGRCLSDFCGEVSAYTPGGNRPVYYRLPAVRRPYTWRLLLAGRASVDVPQVSAEFPTGHGPLLGKGRIYTV